MKRNRAYRKVLSYSSYVSTMKSRRLSKLMAYIRASFVEATAAYNKAKELGYD